MEQVKTALIIIDDSEAIEKAAQRISAALKGYTTVILKAEKFTGTDLLPAHLFILGCEKPNPPSFGYLAQLLQHINLVGRPCGVFSTNEKTIKYLSKLIKASEAKANEPLLLTEGPIASAISKWVKTIPASNF